MKSIWSGIKNLVAWVPIIWQDRDWDWYFLARIMEFKLRKMSFKFQKFDVGNSRKDAKRMLICAALIKRIYEDNYDQMYYKGNDFRSMADKAMRQQARDEEYLFTLMKRWREWWY